MREKSAPRPSWRPCCPGPEENPFYARFDEILEICREYDVTLSLGDACGQDDELSIAMMAFHEAIGGYSRTRGSFLKYAAMLIRSRLVDYSRREQRLYF